jgi:DNA-binding IclR family transcriptional regulator
MKRAEIPAAVLDFVSKRIDSVTELEALLIMCAEESRVWSVDEIAARIYVAKPSAAAVLHALERHRLVVADEAGAQFRFSPASEEERQAVLQTAIAYRVHLIPITTLIHKKASGSVQEFARAFSLKKED